MRDSQTGTLAYGQNQKQWLEICMLLVQNAWVLLLDEPVAGMSAEERTQTGELRRRVQEVYLARAAAGAATEEV